MDEAECLGEKPHTENIQTRKFCSKFRPPPIISAILYSVTTIIYKLQNTRGKLKLHSTTDIRVSRWLIIDVLFLGCYTMWMWETVSTVHASPKTFATSPKTTGVATKEQN